MKSLLMTTSAVLLVTGLAAGQARAACPEDIDAFNREYDKTLQDAAAGGALTTSEQAQLFGLRTAAENLYEAGNAEMCAEVIQRANLLLDSAIAPQVIKPSDLVGREVTNTEDEDLGEIEDVMLDPVSGRIAYVVIEHGGFLGIGDDLFAVPWRAMKFVPGNEKTVLLDISEEKLENAPRFSRKDETPLERREWVTSVHNYYGVEPYWQDDISAVAMQYGAGADGQSSSESGAEPQTEVLIVAPVEESETQAEPQATGEPAASPAASPTKAQSSPEPQPATDTQPAEQAQPSTDTQPSTETQPATQPSTDTKSDAGTDGQAQAAADTQSSTEPTTGGTSLLTMQPSMESSSSGELDTLIARIDQLEQRVEDVAQKDVGADVEESISALEQKVETLSQQIPGEDVKQSIDRLEQDVQQLSEKGVGEEIRQRVAQLEEQVAALGGDGAASSQGTGNQATGDQSNQPAAVSVVPQQSTSEEQSGQADHKQQTNQQQADQQTSGQQTSDQQTSDQQTSDQQTSDQQTADQQTADQQTADQQTADQQTGQATAGGSQQKDQAASEDKVAAAPAPAGESGAESGQPCEEQLAQFEEDLERAEKLGVAVNDAQSEYKEAQAMLNNNSEALCRAAIKRARDELVAVGFEPTQLN